MPAAVFQAGLVPDESLPAVVGGETAGEVDHHQRERGVVDRIEAGVSDAVAEPGDLISTGGVGFVHDFRAGEEDDLVSLVQDAPTDLDLFPEEPEALAQAAELSEQVTAVEVAVAGERRDAGVVVRLNTGDRLAGVVALSERDDSDPRIGAENVQRPVDSVI